MCFLTPYVLEAQNAPSIEWQKCYGGTYTDGCQCMVRTEDGGYILCGSTNSHSGDVVGGHLGVYDDAWIVKIDSNGKLEWQKCLGGNFTEIAYSIIQCFDRGYLVVGLSNSHDGDIVRAIGDTGSTAIPWAAKLDSTGKLQWEKSLDGIVKPWFTGSAYTVIQTPDSNFIIGGEINGAEEGLINHGMFDAYIAKLSPSGVLLMQRAYGGDKDERVSSILQTTDGGYIFSGVTGSKNSGDVQGSTNSDLLHTWTVKLDQSFNIQWQKMLDGSQYGGDLPKIIHTKNHAFVVC